MKQIAAVLTAAAGLAALAACETYDPPTSAVTFGEAVQRNVAVQLVNPEAPADLDPAAFDGDRAALAIGRYKAGEVKEPEELSTSTVGGSGG